MYSVGVTDEGTTFLTLGDDSGYKSTLTMNEGAVLQMIRLLSATLRTVNVTFEGIDNGQCETGEQDTCSPVVETP